MNLLQIREEVRSILKDPGYPAQEINRAINRVLMDINVMGRFRFHQASKDITLQNAVFGYDVDQDILAEELVVLNPDHADASQRAVLRKYPSWTAAVQEGAFSATGDGPKFYARRQNHWFFDPMPESNAAGKIVRIFYHKDLDRLLGDLDVSQLPARYHSTLVAYGAASQIAPNAEVRQGQTASALYKQSLENMIRQELWEPLIVPHIFLDDRFTNLDLMGNVGRVR